MKVSDLPVAAEQWTEVFPGVVRVSVSGGGGGVGVGGHLDSVRGTNTHRVASRELVGTHTGQ